MSETTLLSLLPYAVVTCVGVVLFLRPRWSRHILVITLIVIANLLAVCGNVAFWVVFFSMKVVTYVNQAFANTAVAIFKLANEVNRGEK